MKFPAYILKVPRSGSPELSKYATEEEFHAATVGGTTNQRLNALRTEGTTVYVMHDDQDVNHVRQILRRWQAAAPKPQLGRIVKAERLVKLIARD